MTLSLTVKLYDVVKPSNLSYWQIAAIGAVPVVSLGIWYYFRNKDTDSQSETTNQNGVVKKISVSKQETETSQRDKDKKLEKVETPLERAQSLKDAGNKFFREGNYEDAIRCYSEAIDLCPTSEKNILSTFYQNRAACYDKLNNDKEIVKDCSSALDLNNRYTKALMRRAKALKNLGQYEQCLEDVTALCILENFQNLSSLEMADSVLKELGKIHAAEAMKTKSPMKPSQYFVKSYFSSFPNDPVVNSSGFEGVEVNKLQQNGEQSLSCVEKAIKLLYQGELDQVIPACTEAVEQGEGLEPEALLLRATMFLLQGQHHLAKDDLSTIINSQVQNNKIIVNALIKRASLYIQESDKEKTLQDFETAEKLDPDNPDIYMHRGQVYLLTEETDKSMADFKKCVTLDPTFATAQMQGYYAEYRLAVKETNSTGIVKVTEKFKRAIKKFPKCSESYILLAQILADQQQYDDADEYFKKAVEVDPLNATLRVHRGLLQLQWKGDVDTAKKLINEALTVDDKCSFCYEAMGTIEVQQGNLQRAVDLFEKTIPLTKSETELAHVFSLLDAAKAQLVVAKKYGISILVG